MDEKIVKNSQGLAKDLVNDCISRKAAIDEVINLWADKPFGNPALVEIKDCIEKLPPAQPEKRTDERTGTHACDLISRQALCEYALNQKDKNITANDIMRFPSAQPKSYREGYQAGYKDAQFKNAKRTAETAQNVSDEDLISRKAAMNRIDEALSRVFVDSHGCGETVLRKLPSVKPERNRGHWVGIDDEPYETWECDQCGCIQECFEDELPNYCSNCGADMKGGNS